MVSLGLQKQYNLQTGNLDRLRISKTKALSNLLFAKRQK